jgi:hypothetical protein
VRQFSSFRRAIAYAVILCQLLAVTAFHIPAAHANTIAAPHSSTHCHEAPANDDASGTCKSGLCKCPCAHLPALSLIITPIPSTTPHPPMALVYSAPAAPEYPTKFFRPPI